MNGYIDLHNHILPGIDDGPREIEEAVTLARDLVAAGYSTVVATPHACGGRPHPAVINERLAGLQEELDHQGISLKLLPGAENHISPDLAELVEQKEALTINHTRYLLLELPMLQPLPPYTEKLLQNLRVKGYIPVIPHPERVIVLNRRHELIYKLYRAGAIYQVTWAALLGYLGSTAKRTAQMMLDTNLAHLFATDAHHSGTRLLAGEKVAAMLDQKQQQELSTLMLKSRPELLIDNQPLDLPEALTPAEQLSPKTNIFARLFRS